MNVLRRDFDPLREALEYVREHHLDGDECLCDAARSVVESGLRLSEQQQAGAVGDAEALAHAVSASLEHGERSPLATALSAYLEKHPWTDL